MATLSPDRGSQSRPITIGAVCRSLKEEFPDVSISKIRFLEDQGLVSPRRTQGGYRLFAEEDVERLRTILRLQRDEFLPLRVIRQELASPASASRKGKRPADGLRAPETEIDFETLCRRSGADPKFVRELEEYGLVEAREDGGERLYGERDVEVAAACARLSHYGAEPRNLRSFRTGAEREVGLLEQIVGPALRSKNPERLQAGIDDLEQLAALSRELSQLLFWRALRSIVSR